MRGLFHGRRADSKFSRELQQCILRFQSSYLNSQDFEVSSAQLFKALKSLTGAELLCFFEHRESRDGLKVFSLKGSRFTSSWLRFSDLSSEVRSVLESCREPSYFSGSVPFEELLLPCDDVNSVKDLLILPMLSDDARLGFFISINHKKEFSQQRLMAFSESNRHLASVFHSERVRADQLEASKEFEKKKRQMDFTLRGTGSGLWSWDVEKDEMISDSLLDTLGIESRGLKTIRDWGHSIHPDDRGAAMRLMLDFVSGKTQEFQAEHRFRLKSGEYVPMSNRAICERDAEGKAVMVFGAISNISEQKRNQELLASISRVGSIGGWEWCLEKDEIIWTEEMFNIHGLPQSGEVSAELSFRFYPENSKNILMSVMERSIKEGIGFDVELDFCRATGEKRVGRSIGRVEKRAGHVVRIFGTFQDITEQKSLRDELKTSERRLRLALEASAAGIWDWDIRSNVMHIDQRWQRIHDLLCARHEVGYDEWIDRMHQEDREHFESSLKRHFHGEIPKFGFSYRYRMNDGSYRWLMTEGRCLRDAFERPYRVVGWSRDITEEKQADDLIEAQRLQLLNSSKMSALGEMAGGIAHEINNPLAIIIGRCDTLVKRLENKSLNVDEMSEQIGVIKSTGHRIARIVRSLRSFAREGLSDPFDLVNVKEIVDETLDLCSEKFKANGVEVRMVNISEHQELSCRKTEISQVLLNLLNNSFDAIESRQSPWVEIECFDEGDNIVISVKDCGEGINALVADKILEPFFTTKEAGKGTGLGLSISKSLVLNHGGDLRLNTDCPNTCFEILLPKIHPEEDDSIDSVETG